jgi:hypothetical protein
MGPTMSNKFIPVDRDTPFVIPVQDWLPEEHLARFIVEIVESLDVTALEAAYRGGDSAPYPPKMRLDRVFKQSLNKLGTIDVTRLSRIFPLTKLLDEVLVSLETVGFIQEGAHDLHHTATVYQGVYRPA